LPIGREGGSVPSTAPLQRTVRRCTAVLIAALGIGFWRIPGPWREVPLFLTVGAVVFLLWSFGVVPGWHELVDTE
jgi:hypothetical protein